MAAADTIDVWQVPTAVAPAELRRLCAVLSPEERARLQGGGARKERWAAGRAALRLILGSYVGVAPESLAFAADRHGKPAVEGLHFSRSDSGDRALVAVSRRAPVGVDIERVDERRPVTRIARRFFPPEEAALVDGHAAFYRRWVAMEAYGKGLGVSIWRQLAAEPESEWRVRALAVPRGYAGALAAPGEWTYRLRTWELT